MLIFLQVADSYYNETIILKKKWATFKQCFFSSSSIYTIIIYTIPPLRVRLPWIIPSTPFNNNFLCVSVKHLQLPSSDSLYIYIYPPKKLTPPKKNLGAMCQDNRHWPRLRFQQVPLPYNSMYHIAGILWSKAVGVWIPKSLKIFFNHSRCLNLCEASNYRGVNDLFHSLYRCLLMIWPKTAWCE